MEEWSAGALECGVLEECRSRSRHGQFSRSSEPCKEQSDPIFRFWAKGDSRGFPLFTLSASRYFGNKETLCLYWPLGTVVITGPKVLNFYAAFLFQPGNVFQSGWKDIVDLNLILNGNSNAEHSEHTGSVELVPIKC